MRTFRASRRVSPALAFLIAGLALSSCTNKITRPTGGGPPGMKMAVTPDSVQSIFTANCALANCHLGSDAPFGEQLQAGSSYESTVGVPSSEQPSLLRIEPGNAADSYLVRKIDGDPRITGQQMPLGAPPLSNSLRDVIRNWVDQGALPDSVVVSPVFVGSH